MGSMVEPEDPEEVLVAENVSAKERLDRYTLLLPVVLYNLVCLVMCIGLLVWVAIVHASRDLPVLIAEGVLTAAVVVEVTLRVALVGCKQCCKYPMVWMDAALCYSCLMLYLGVVLVPHIIYETEEEETYESTGTIVLLVLRFVLQVIRGGVMLHRQTGLYKTTAARKGVVIDSNTTVRKDEFGHLLPPGANDVGGVGTRSQSQSERNYGTDSVRLSFPRWSFGSKRDSHMTAATSAADDKDGHPFNPLLR